MTGWWVRNGSGRLGRDSRSCRHRSRTSEHRLVFINGCGAAQPRHTVQAAANLRHTMISCVKVWWPLAAAAAALAVSAGQPRVHQHVFSGQPLVGFALQQTANETLCTAGKVVGEAELSAANFCKQAAVLRTMEWISEKEKKTIKPRQQRFVIISKYMQINFTKKTFF